MTLLMIFGLTILVPSTLWLGCGNTLMQHLDNRGWFKEEV